MAILTHVGRSLNRRSIPDPTYQLRRYWCRSVLTLVGPLIVLAFYVFVCTAYLTRPPVNGIVSLTQWHLVDGNWIFYLWFLVSVFMLDWARTALANIEACALMHPSLASSTAANLMWHTDANWANQTWWYRALSAYGMNKLRRGSGPARVSRCLPGRLWVSLAVAMSFMFLAIPLSGLSLQTIQVKTPSSVQTTINGPNRTNFQNKGADHREAIMQQWRSGRQTTPRSGAIFYAPTTVSNVSAIYFQDQAAKNAPYIESFLGPAVDETVTGRAWGIWSNISCQLVSNRDLQLMRYNDMSNWSINLCLYGNTSHCNPRWVTIDSANMSKFQHELPQTPPLWPLWYEYENGLYQDLSFEIMYAADGYSKASMASLQDFTPYTLSPYFSEYGHDIATLDHSNGMPMNDMTHGVLEVQLRQYSLNDTKVKLWIQEFRNISNVTDALERVGWPMVGISLHCDIATLTGSADLDPTSKHFSGFTMSAASSNNITLPRFYAYQTNTSFDNLFPLQVKLIKALANAYERELTNNQDVEYLQRRNVNLLVNDAERHGGRSPPGAENSGDLYRASFPERLVSQEPLKPPQVQTSIYKLFGEVLIDAMEADDITPWIDGLYELRDATYVAAGPVPWQYVLALLTAWTAVTCIGALWMILTNGPRWAPALNGFEMFKFGAQYADELNELTDVDFRYCGLALSKIPGMVGVLPGAESEASSRLSVREQDRVYFIGLSEMDVGQRLRNSSTKFTFNRLAAATSRY